jgi:hypothetical protein
LTVRNVVAFGNLEGAAIRKLIELASDTQTEEGGEGDLREDTIEPGMKGGQATALGSTELHEHGAGGDVLDFATLDIESLLLQCHSCGGEDVGEELFGVGILIPKNKKEGSVINAVIAMELKGPRKGQARTGDVGCRPLPPRCTQESLWHSDALGAWPTHLEGSLEFGKGRA